MAQESNFYRLYRLANQDRIQSFKTSFLAITIFACFALGSLLTMGLSKNFSWKFLGGGVASWSIGFALLLVLTLVSSTRDFTLWAIPLSFVVFLPLYLQHQISRPVLLSVAAIFVLLLLNRWKIRREYNALINLNWGRIVRRGSFLFTVILIIIGFVLLFFSSSSLSWQKIGTKASDALISSTQTSFFAMLPHFSLTETIDEILNKYAKQQLIQSGLEEGMDSMVSEPLLQSMKSNLSGTINYPIKGNETIPELVVNWFKAKWPTFPLPIKVGIGILVFFLFWSLINFLDSLLFLILLLEVSLIIQLLTALKFIKVSHSNVEKEILTI